MKRNLIYHIVPFVGNKTWVDNIQHLLKYIHVFNNKRVINIATGENLSGPEQVKQYFAGQDIEFIVSANDPKKWETASFRLLLERVYSLDPSEITFYAHTKGVSHEGKNLEAVTYWYRSMYRYNLGNIRKIENVLKKYPCCGCFKHTGNPHHFPDFSKWHFSGSFFWFNNQALFRNNWSDIAQTKYATEAYLSKFFTAPQAYSLFGIDCPYLYMPSYWRTIILFAGYCHRASMGFSNNAVFWRHLSKIYITFFYLIHKYRGRIKQER